ncbi:FAD-binding protein [Candidatus Dependentiae bacterium]|nr:FAD-binding protein [Candidatus Dependentiae bacterium]
MRRFFILKKHLFLFIIASLATLFCAGYHKTITNKTASRDIYPVVIIGGGIGGLSASIFLASKNISSLVLEGELPGGQLTLSSSVRNWPSIPDLPGEEIVKQIRNHAEKLNVRIISTNASEISRQGDYFHISSPQGIYKAFNVIIATGTTPKKLNIPGEDTFWGNGISDCAICDGGLYPQKTVVVVGGGQSAIEEALHLSTIAKKVIIVVRKSALKSHEASRLASLKSKPNIVIVYDSIVTSAQGIDSKLNSITTLNIKTQEQSTLAVDGLFLAIGSTPNSNLFKDLVECDLNGFIKTGRYGKTSCNGIFAIGDVTHSKYRQAIMVAEHAAITANALAAQIDKSKSFYAYSEDNATILAPQKIGPQTAKADYHVVFVNANAASYTAAIYLQHAGYKTAIIKTSQPANHNIIWPGDNSATQKTILNSLEKHALSAGSKLIEDTVVNEDYSAYPYALELKKTSSMVTSYCLIDAENGVPFDSEGLQEVQLCGVGARIGLQISEKLQEYPIIPTNQTFEKTSTNVEQPKKITRPATIPHIKTIKELNTILKENDAVFIDCYAHWCPPCKRLKPLLEKIYAENRYPQVYIACVDVDEAQEIAEELGVQSLPTLLSFKRSKLTGKSLGFKNESELSLLIEKLL